MGCQFNLGIIPKKDKPKRRMVEEYLNRIIRNAKEDYGSAGYTGSFAESTGVLFRNRIFDSVESAEDWLENNCKKGYEILVVKTECYWVYGANCPM